MPVKTKEIIDIAVPRYLFGISECTSLYFCEKYMQNIKSPKA